MKLRNGAIKIYALQLMLVVCGLLEGCSSSGQNQVNAPAITPPTVTPPPIGAAQCISRSETGPSADLEQGTFLAEDVINSASIGVAFHICVYLPPGYADSTISYPVLYHTDGELIGPTAIRLESLRKQVIIVGIGGNYRRETDLIFPGWTNYFQFIINDVMPVIEAKYRIDKTRRSLAGHSLGGNFVVGAALMDAATPPHFNHYLSTDGSFFESPNEMQNLLNARANKSKNFPITLWMMGSTFEGNGPVVKTMADQITAKNFSGLDLKYSESAIDDHFSALATSELWAFPSMFPTDNAPYGTTPVTIKYDAVTIPLTYYGNNTYWGIADVSAGTHQIRLSADKTYGVQQGANAPIAGERINLLPNDNGISLTMHATGSYVFKVDVTNNQAPVFLFAERGSPFSKQAIYIVGSLNNWGFTNQLIQTSSGTYVADIPLDAGSYQFKIASIGWQAVDVGALHARETMAIGTVKPLAIGGANIGIMADVKATYRFTLTTKNRYAPLFSVTKL